ncbi:hypothetical protein [uncultured Brevibacillus sp.]|uniref:hypothetical protein n=1 Tax=uncultured Brevibacillus sp. TaxID=169970 RepID=UPI002592D734|nr:hypothetical protein [uncultured Brevibacillus sp.]
MHLVNFDIFYKFKKRKSIFFVSFIALVIACTSTYVYWYNTPEKTMDRYLSLIINKQGEEAYDLVYKDNHTYYPERVIFIRSAKDTQLTDYKVLGSTNLEKSLAEVKVVLSFKHLQREKTFMMKKAFGQWYVLLRGQEKNENS